jgi:hypothetical protein
MGYNPNTSQSGILLLESVQQLKYYVQNIKFEAVCLTHFNFDGLFEPESLEVVQDLKVEEKTYKTTIKLNDASLSVAMNFTVDDKGDIQVNLPLLSLTVQPENVEIQFDGAKNDDFIALVSETLIKTKNYLLSNTNSLISENKDLIRKLH